MNEGDVLIASLPQSDGSIKNRPALLLRALPPFKDLLVCGISTQLRQAVPGFDDIIVAADPDFAASSLVGDSVIRLGFLAVIPRSSVAGTIGAISSARHHRLLRRLSDYLIQNIPPS